MNNVIFTIWIAFSQMYSICINVCIYTERKKIKNILNIMLVKMLKACFSNYV